ncbi:MAG: hypothetical protein B6I34_09555 [Anaerolineaceae bacterium 4572_32.1]|nr:MAG: hypothetical protein B6I34_09555 [Anaerolineaceae bacterium 4572_32.1]
MRAPELLAREDNPRRVVAEQRIRRGRVLDRHGKALAWSEIDAEGYAERRYAGGWLAHAVGYYSLRYGVSGIEAAFDEQLRGEPDHITWASWRNNLLHRPQIGQDIQVSLDAALQRAAGEALEGQSGAIVLLDAETGEVLALVSAPTFDPNRLDEEWDTLSEATDKPLFNRALQGLYPPGATFNTIVMAAALEENLTTADEIFQDKDGREQFGKAVVRCANHPGLDTFDLLHAAAYGCNVTFARLSLRLGSEKLANYAEWFGLGLSPAFEIPAPAGQVASTFPGPTLLPNPESIARGVITPQTARLVRRAMVLAVSEGLAGQIALPDLSIAGKAGTAEAGQDSAPHAWFIGFAPAGQEEKPRFAIAVVVEHGGEGAQVAAPIAARLLKLAADSRTGE